MTSYDDVIDTIRDNDIEWHTIDRIELHEDTHLDFYARSRGDHRLSNHETNDMPAVRVTSKAEKIVYVDKSGEVREQTL